MNDLARQSLEFFKRESSFAFSTACALMLEGREHEARVFFLRSVNLDLRVKAEKARQFEATRTD